MKHMGWIAGCLAGMVMGAMAEGPPQEMRPHPPMAQGKAGIMDGSGELMMLTRPIVAKQLNLSPEQQAQIAAAISTSSNAMSALRTKIQMLAKEQAKLMGASEVDEAAIVKLAGEIGDARTEIAVLQVRHMLAARKILTVEQRQQLREMMRKFMDRREGPGPGGKRERKAGEGHARPIPPPPVAE